MSYPLVLDELQTMKLVASGRSIARFGDGELKMAFRGAGIKSQDYDPSLAERLRDIITDSGECLVGIPNIHDVVASDLSTDQKIEHWSQYLRFRRDLNLERSYVSAFITRPDSAPWINTPEYWNLVQSLWAGRDVTVVGGSHKSLKPEDLVGAKTITHVLCRKQHAWQDYDEILERIGTPELALICLGPTATVLAADLCAKGVHAIDLGHVGMFLRKWRRQEPMVVTDYDKSVDRMALA